MLLAYECVILLISFLYAICRFSKNKKKLTMEPNIIQERARIPLPIQNNYISRTFEQVFGIVIFEYTLLSMGRRQYLI